MANVGKRGTLRGTDIGTVSISFLWLCLIADTSRVGDTVGLAKSERGKPSWLADMIFPCLLPSAEPLEAHGASTKQETDPGKINYIPESKLGFGS